jgi:phosphopantetheinyl transferase
MKTTKNSIFQFTQNNVEFFLSQKSDWKMNEITLNEEEKQRYLKINNSSRGTEFLGVRFLKNYYDEKLEINYLKSGKPIIKNGAKHISISHCKNYVAFAVASHHIGIDIEECHGRIFKVKDRFLNEKEKELFDQDSILELTISWCVKEALFKLNEDSGLSFKNDLIIVSWDKSSTVFAKMRQNMKWINVKLHVELIDNLVLCFNFE